MRAPQELLESHGLIQPNSYVHWDENDVPHLTKPSWEELKGELVQAREMKSEQLRNLCSELLRRRNDDDWRPLDWADRVKFTDSMAEFEARLPGSGNKFDGFKIVGTTAVQSVVQLADEALLGALQSVEFPRSESIRKGVSEAVQHLSEDKYAESLMKLRSALQRCLEAIVGDLAAHEASAAPSFKEDWEVRDYLEKKGFLTREERRGFDGIYGLLSSGPHDKGDKDRALLGYAACIMACHYAITKFHRVQGNQPKGTV
jgi:hypothetical protein